MVPALRSRLRAVQDRELLTAAVAALATMLLALLGAKKLGGMGLLAPLAVATALIVMRRPVVMVSVTVGLAILCEGSTFGLFNFTSHLYDEFYKGLTPLDALVALTVVSVGWELVRERRAPILPRALALPLALLWLAMIAGAVTGHGAGASLRSVILSENVLSYLLLLPLAVVNLRLERRQLVTAITALAMLAIFKAAVGLIEVFGHYGQPIEGRATLTYYEPTANWLVMLTIFGALAMVVSRLRPPRWLLLGSPLLIASLVLSYRRSFWIGAVLCLLLIVVLGLSPSRRRVLIPAVLLLIVAVWAIGSVNFQSSGSPIVKRLASLSPSKIEANVQDRYRLNERANVLSEIGRHPITGLGMDIPWTASAQTLSVEHPQGRLYVHFAALWFWLKLGILGLLAYVAVLVGMATVAWQAWKHSPEPALKAFGLVSLCAVGALAAIETTASFTGIDARFTALLGAQIGLLALAARLPAPVPVAEEPHRA